MTLYEAVDKMVAVKSELLSAITQKGGDISADTKIEDYPEAVLSIPVQEMPDLPTVSVEPESVRKGVTAIDSDGNVVIGTMPDTKLEQFENSIYIQEGYTAGESITIGASEQTLDGNKLTVTPGYVAETVTLEVPPAEIVADEKKVTIGIGYVNKKQEFVIQTVEGADVQYGYWTDEGMIQLIDVTGDVAQNIVDDNNNGKTLSLTPQIFSIPSETVDPDLLSVPLTFTAVDVTDSIVGLTLYYSGSSSGDGANKMPVYSVNGSEFTPFFIVDKDDSDLEFKGGMAGIDISHDTVIRVQGSGDSEGEFSSEKEYYNFKTGSVRNGEYIEGELDGSLAASGNVMSLLGFADACSPYCFQSLFSGAHLTTVPLFPSHTMAKWCYAHIFQDAILESVPVLPATVMAEGCYRHAFRGATLPHAPELPAKKLAKECYKAMFAESNITSIELPAEVLAEGCYNEMFVNCDELTEIAVHFTAWVEGATEDWVDGVASEGTFYKPAALPEIRGTSYIPAGWKIKDIGEFEEFEI